MPVIVWTEDGVEKRARILPGVDVAEEAARIGAPEGYQEYADGSEPTPRPEPPTAADIGREAQRRIAEVMDERTQKQLMQRALRLVVKVAISGEALTSAELAEIAAGSARTDQVEAIQAAEAALVANPPATIAAMKNSPVWP